MAEGPTPPNASVNTPPKYDTLANVGKAYVIIGYISLILGAICVIASFGMAFDRTVNQSLSQSMGTIATTLLSCGVAMIVTGFAIQALRDIAKNSHTTVALLTSLDKKLKGDE